MGEIPIIFGLINNLSGFLAKMKNSIKLSGNCIPLSNIVFSIKIIATFKFFLYLYCYVFFKKLYY